MRTEATVQRLCAQAYTIPTDFPEADGTASWASTTIVIVHADAAGRRGIGYTYTDASAAALIAGTLAKAVIGRDAMDPPSAWRAMQVAVRNLGRDGVAATAISAVDTALWDLKAVLLALPAGMVQVSKCPRLRCGLAARLAGDVAVLHQG